jgi:hypothetical protein
MPETPEEPKPEAGIVQRYEPPPGAIPLARVKRVAIVVMAAGLFACLKVGSLVNDLTSGTAFSGASVSIPFLRRFF